MCFHSFCVVFVSEPLLCFCFVSLAMRFSFAMFVLMCFVQNNVKNCNVWIILKRGVLIPGPLCRGDLLKRG